MPTYRYDATTSAGEAVAGTIDAGSADAGRTKLAGLALTLRHFEPVAPVRVSPLGSADLIAFNDQLAHLARAGLPVESGLRLLAQDVSHGRLRAAITALVNDLDNGATLPQALDRHRRAFPPLYANLVDAGIRTGNLPAVLFNLGTHLDLTTRIRAAISRSIAYPTILLLALVLVSAYLSAYVLPALTGMFHEQRSGFEGMWSYRRNNYTEPPGTPWITQAALAFGIVSPYVAAVTVAVVVLSLLLWPFLRGTGLGRGMVDSFFARLPLFGPPLRFSLIGRWCDAVRIGVEAGLDLPASFALASDALGSRRLRDDTTRFIDTVGRGGTLASVTPLRILPASVPASIDRGIASNTLAETMASLAALYMRQAEVRARMIPLTLTPILIVIIAIVVGGLLTALFVPIIRLLNAIMS